MPDNTTTPTDAPKTTATTTTRSADPISDSQIKTLIDATSPANRESVKDRQERRVYESLYAHLEELRLIRAGRK